MGLLDDVVGGVLGAQQGGSASPIKKAVLGLLTYSTLKTGGQSGTTGATAPSGPSGLLGGIMGGMAGASGGSLLSKGLSELLQQFRDAGQGDKAESWVSNSANKEISPAELEKVLGPERIQWLEQHTGMSHDELLAGLSKELPKTVDQLTPNGNVPKEADASRVTT
jgi:uncharacterized protein YidB (DUF937 family)